MELVTKTCAKCGKEVAAVLFRTEKDKVCTECRREEGREYAKKRAFPSEYRKGWKKRQWNNNPQKFR